MQFADAARGEGRSQGDKLAGAMPGRRQAVAAVVVAGLACWFGVLPQLTAEGPTAAPVSSAMAMVAAADIDAAITTLDGSKSAVGRLRDDVRDCRKRLAWVSLARQPSSPPTTVRLRSGDYFSPVFTPTDTPLRVAIPYPAPFEAGRGTLIALTSGGTAIVALTPVWRLPDTAGETMRAVTWNPAEPCVRAVG